VSKDHVIYKGFLVDANAVNDGLDGHLNFDDLRRQYGRGYCTKHLERELLGTKDATRRDQLMAFYSGLELEAVDSATAAAMTASPDIAKVIWEDVNTIKAGVIKKCKKPRRKRTIDNSHVDALHAEAAKRLGLTLATGDAPLADTAEGHGVKVTRTRKRARHGK